MIDKKKLLEEHQLWPMASWNKFDFIHEPFSDPIEEEKMINLIRSRVVKANGLYCYFKGEQCLYVGKAKPLFNRLKSHYRESNREVPGDTRDKLWHRFFSSRRGNLTVYWKQVEDEVDRQIFELALQEILKPEFEDYRKRVQVVER